MSPSLDRRLGISAIAVAALAVLALLLTRSWTAPPGASDMGASPGSERPTARSADLHPGGMDDATPGMERTRLDGASESDERAARLSIVRGRCVDENGEPLAAVVVRLDGMRRNSEALAQYELDHGEVEWTDPDEVVTGEDGRFEIAFDPPPPYSFTIEAETEGRVALYSRWSNIPAGSQQDLGDLVLVPGALVRGIVLDERGGAVADAQVAIEVTSRPSPFDMPSEPWLRPRDRVYATTDARGRFATAATDALAPGAYGVEVDAHTVIEPAEAFEVSVPSTDLVVTVRRADVPDTITGIVVDDSGAPVHGARVSPAQFNTASVTDRDGRFVVKRNRRSTADTTALRVIAKGHPEWESVEPVAWRTTDLRIVLDSGPPLTIRATRADDGSPVERFGVVLAPIHEDGSYTSSDGELRHLGEHAGGVLSLPRVTPARYRVAVDPSASDDLAKSVFHEVDCTTGAPQVLDVSLHAIVEKAIEVVTSDGRPAAGVRVELLEKPLGPPVDTETVAVDPVRAVWRHPALTAVLHESRATGTSGRVTLRGAKDRDYALRLPGPGHVPRVVQPFRFDDEQHTRIVAEAGGTLFGRLTPGALIASLAEEKGAKRVPGLVLMAPGTRFPSRHAAPGGVPFEPDGSFEIVGIPPGRWDVVLLHPLEHDWSARCIAESIEFRDGERHELVLDLSDWVAREVELHLSLDGTPFSGRFGLEGRLAQIGGAEPVQEFRDLRVNNGTVTDRLTPGRWGGWVFATPGGSTVRLPIEPFDVVADESVQRVERAVRCASRAVQLTDASGQPVARVSVRMRAPDGTSLPPFNAMTDEAGRLTLHGPPSTVRLFVRREPLQDDRAWYEWKRTRSPDERNAAFVDLGTLELVDGGGPEVALQLPPEWHEMPQ